mgnify:CR=1 FL=1
MKLLAVESTSMVAGAALIQEDKLIGEIRINHRKTHSEQLLPLIDELLTHCECPLSSLDALAVSLGPGSFTGIRIGVATVKGLAQALQIPVIGVTTLEALAWQADTFAGRIVPLMDAQKNLVYTAEYQFNNKGNQSLAVLREPDVLHIQELLDTLKIGEDPLLFLGDAMPLHTQWLMKAFPTRGFFASPHHVMPSAGALAQCAIWKALAGEGVPAEQIQPVYLRTAQAERAYRQRQFLLSGEKQ